MTKHIKASHLTSVHHPLDVRILYRECSTLARAGYEVVLIAPHERDELVNEVRVRAVPKPNNRAERMTRTVWQVFRAALHEHADIYHFHDPELIPIGLLLRLNGKRVIYDVHENVPQDILTKNYLHPLLRRVTAGLIELTEQIGAAYFDGIVAATPTIAERFPAGKTVTVQNFPVPDEGRLATSRPYTERSPIVTYIGAMTAVRGVKEMIQAMTCLPGSLNAKLVLAGSCDFDLESAIRRMPGWDLVEFTGWLSREDLTRLLANAKVGLVLLHPIRTFVESYPIKMFEYMAAGIPVVASNFPLWDRIIGESRCGILVDPMDIKSIAAAIQWLLQHPREAEEMGRNGRDAVLTRYNWATEGERLTSFYSRLTGGGLEHEHALATAD